MTTHFKVKMYGEEVDENTMENNREKIRDILRETYYYANGDTQQILLDRICALFEEECPAAGKKPNKLISTKTMDKEVLKRKIAALFPRDDHEILSERGQGYIDGLLKVLEVLDNEETD